MELLVANADLIAITGALYTPAVLSPKLSDVKPGQQSADAAEDCADKGHERNKTTESAGHYSRSV
jgi:hypothetical protein